MRVRDDAKVQLVKQKAMEMVVSDGFEGFSVNKLAKVCGISVATLYIYYKDKDDLIVKVALEEAERMKAITLDQFDPEMPFIDGLRMQWANRARYALEHTTALMFFEQLRTSTYQEQVMAAFIKDFKTAMGRFIHNAVSRGEIAEMTLEVYWSVAFAPLYSLLRFHNEGRSIGGKKFKIDEEVMWKTFNLVIKALYTGDNKQLNYT